MGSGRGPTSRVGGQEAFLVMPASPAAGHHAAYTSPGSSSCRRGAAGGKGGIRGGAGEVCWGYCIADAGWSAEDEIYQLAQGVQAARGRESGAFDWHAGGQSPSPVTPASACLQQPTPPPRPQRAPPTCTTTVKSVSPGGGMSTTTRPGGVRSWVRTSAVYSSWLLHGHRRGRRMSRAPRSDTCARTAVTACSTGSKHGQ